ncbi:FCD domain-containing protein [Streptomyces collinus]|uniref:FCD domain-containing protein n=1 Tax=Streptomyces collinus TaxID=42684 RepID=UPI0036B3CA94
MRELPAHARWSGLAAADLASYVALVEAAGSAQLHRLRRGLPEEARMGLVQSEAHGPQRAGLADEHEQILDALEAGDAGAARNLMRAHLSSAVRALTDDRPPAPGDGAGGRWG